MIYGMYTSANGMRVQMRRQDVISNNLANSSTTGFKRDLFTMQEMGSENQMIGRLGSSRNETVDQFGGPVIHSTRIDHEQGALTFTDNPFDLAIEGKGFFKLKNPINGEFSYTRNGNFAINKEGYLANTDNGHLVLDQSDNPISVTEISNVKDAVKVVSFNDLNGLQKQEGTAFKLQKNKAGVLPTEIPVASEVRTGYLEESNANSINEMVNMIEAHRAYQSNATALKQQDENLGRLISIAKS